MLKQGLGRYIEPGSTKSRMHAMVRFMVHRLCRMIGLTSCAHIGRSFADVPLDMPFDVQSGYQ